MIKARGILTAIVCVALVSTIGIGVSAQTKAPFGLWVWSAEAEATSHRVSVELSDGKWRGSVDEKPTSVSVADRTVTVEAPGGQSFLGRLADDDFSIQGHWTQPSSQWGYGEMVTPTVLSAQDENRWGARVDLQPRPFRVFLDIFSDEDGNIGAVVRNPERNEIMRARRFRVEPDGERRWSLVAGSGDREIRQSLKETDDGLELDHSWFDSPLILRRATAENNEGYFPRDPATESLQYTPPPQLDDGWEVITAEDAGFDRAALDTLVTELSTADPRSQRPRLIHAVLAAHKGRLVFEEYFHGYDRETPHDTRSLGKVFAPVLVGALQQQSIAIDADVRPIADVLLTAEEDIDDPRKSDITLAHLMSFSSGLDCDVNNPDSVGNEDRMWEQQEEDDFWLYTARLQQLHEPGERYAYCSGSINLVGASISAFGEKPIVDLFNELIAEPLRFGSYHWNLAPNGAAYLGGGPYMRPRDILKIGAMFAADGTWDGEQIIDPHWVKESTTVVMDITPETTGMTSEDFGNSYFGGATAYEWRIDEVRAGDTTYASYEATGNGGQILLVVPDLDLVVLFMGGNYRQGGIWGRWRNEIVGGHIVPAMRELP
ncbi:MAG: beta-lactamase family protein [Gammaproteobacteria bacterium]|nr:beta-lactamase family protein [Gammaproteobacteria bacterium]